MFICFSCNKIIEVDFPELEEKLIIESLFSPDSTFSVFVSRTTNFDDSNVYFIDDATCKLFANDEFLFEFNYQDTGFYIAPDNYKPLPGVLYKIEVTHPDLPEVWAEDSIPVFKPSLSNIQLIDSARFDCEGYYYADVYFNFTDLKNQDNYYELSLFVREDTVPDIGLSISKIEWFENLKENYFTIIRSDDFILTNESLIDYYPIRYPFSDMLFSASTHQFSIYYNTKIYSSFIAYHTLFIKLRSTSHEYYNYRKKQILHKNNQMGDFWTGTGNPVQMYTNVHNGYGIFAGYQEVVDSIKNY